MPPVRRLPSILWKRIQNDLQEYLVIREADSSKVMAWYHRQFIERCESRYSPLLQGYKYYTKKSDNVNNDDTIRDHMTTLLKEYFKGVWAEKKKPFSFTEKQAQKLGLSSTESEAKRYVPKQPAIFKSVVNGKTVIRINERKVSELANVIYKMYDMDNDDLKLQECNEELFYNVEYLYSMITLDRLLELNAMLTNLSLSISDDEEMLGMTKRESFLMARAIGSDIALIKERPEAALILISNQFLPFYNLLGNVTKLIDQVDSVGRDVCALVAPHQQVETGGGHAFFKLMNHIGPVHDFLFSSSGVLYSISEKIIGVSVTDNGTSMFLNRRPLELPAGDYFTMIRSPVQDLDLDIDSSDDESAIPHGLWWQALYLATNYCANVYMYDNNDGTLLGLLDVEHDTADIDMSARVRGMVMVADQDTDTVVVFVWYDTHRIVAYEAHTRKMLMCTKLDDRIITSMRKNTDTEWDDNISLINTTVAFLTDRGLIVCFPVKITRSGKESQATCNIGNRFDVQLQISGQLAAVAEQKTAEDETLIYATDDARIHVSSRLELIDPASSIKQKPHSKEVLNATLHVNTPVASLHHSSSKYSDMFAACTVDTVILIHIVNLRSDESELSLDIIKTIKRHYDSVSLVGEGFLIGYEGSRIEGIMMTSDEDRVKLNQAFSFAAHRLPITKMEASEGKRGTLAYIISVNCHGLGVGH